MMMIMTMVEMKMITNYDKDDDDQYQPHSRSVGHSTEQDLTRDLCKLRRLPQLSLIFIELEEKKCCRFFKSKQIEAAFSVESATQSPS